MKKQLLKSLFNPDDGSPLSHIVLTNNPSYLESRAVEMIHDAQRMVPSGDGVAYEDAVTKAISLLVCAVLKRQES